MVELVGQRRQRPAARPAEYDLPYQVTGQPIRQYGARHSQHLSRGLPGAGQAGIIQHSQLSRYPCLQPLQQRPPARPAAHLASASRKTSLITIASCPACSPPDGLISSAVAWTAAVAACRSARS